MKKLVLAAAAGVVMMSSAWADTQYKILVLAMPSKYHYEYIPIARESFERLGKLHAFDMTFTNKPEVFDGDLKQYAAVMFLNTPPEELNEARRKKFEAYMQDGGNAMLVHRSLIIPANTWPWYEKLGAAPAIIRCCRPAWLMWSTTNSPPRSACRSTGSGATSSTCSTIPTRSRLTRC
jgi:hypothetical protein